MASLEDNHSDNAYLMQDQTKQAHSAEAEIKSNFASGRAPRKVMTERYSKIQSLYISSQKFCNQFWVVEIVSCFVSVVAFLMIITVLAVEKGRTSNEWRHSISINTIIAILTAIMKAAMLLPVTESISQLKWLWYSHPNALSDIDVFDAASRGTWGAFLFLTHHARRSLATVGAVLTILALAVDPFSQQVIQTVPCTVQNPNSTVQVPKTQQYAFQAGRVSRNLHPLDIDVILAVQNGLIGTPVSEASLLAPSCPSGNCTFTSDQGASYASLAICHKCTDLTSSINKTVLDASISRVRYQVPSGAAVQDQYLANSSVPTEFPGDSVPVNLFGEDLFTFDTIMLQNPITSEGYDAAFATRCSLYPCAKVYSSEIVSSTFNETELSSTALTLSSTGFSLLLNRTLRNGDWQNCDTTSVPDGGHTIPVANGTVQDLSEPISQPISYVAEDCVFSLTDVVPFQQYLYNLLANQTVYGVPGTAQGERNISVYAGDTVLQNLFQAGNATFASIDRQMTTLDNYLTNAIRSNNNASIIGNQPAIGVGSTFDLCIEVEWGWLSLPATLLLVTIAFLAITITRTIQLVGYPGMPLKYRTAMSLKSSQLPLLYYGVDKETRTQLGQPRDVIEMDENAHRVQVRLQHADNLSGYTFTSQKL